MSGVKGGKNSPIKHSPVLLMQNYTPEINELPNMEIMYFLNCLDSDFE